jgi:hypothetical protein
LASVLARSKGRSERRQEATVTGTARWQASLLSNQRGKLVTRRAVTRETAIAAAIRMLDDAADMVQLHGEVLAIELVETTG